MSPPPSGQRADQPIPASLFGRCDACPSRPKAPGQESPIVPGPNDPRAPDAPLLIAVAPNGAGIYRAREQMAVVREVRPEAASVSIRELLADGTPERELAGFFAWLARAAVMTQIVLYDAGDVRRWIALRGRGIVPEGRWFLLFVLGRHADGTSASPRDLLPFVLADDGVHPWAVCAFGEDEHRCVLAGAVLGGHVRVGFENNLLLRDGGRSPDNATLVRQAAEGAAALGRGLAGAEEIRAWFREG